MAGGVTAAAPGAGAAPGAAAGGGAGGGAGGAWAEGRAAFGRGDAAGALAAFRRARAGPPGQPGALPSNVAACLLRLGRPGEALRAAEECVELEPGWVKGYYRKGEALAAMGRHGAAAQAFGAALEICPGDAALLAKAREQERLRGASGGGLGGGARGAPPEAGPAFDRRGEGGGLVAALEAAAAALEGPDPGAERRGELASAVQELLGGGAGGGGDLVFAREQLKERIRLLKLQERAAAERRGEGGEPGGGAPAVQAPPEKPVSALRKARMIREGSLSLGSAKPAPPPARKPQSAPELGAERPWSKKRCRMCGNVTHKSMNTCTSCYLPLKEPKTFEPCFDAPVVGGGVAPFRGARPLPIAAQSGQDASGPSESFYVAPAPRGGAPSLTAAPPRTPPPVGPAVPVRGLASHYAALGLPLGAGQVEVRRAYLELLWEEHPSSGGEPEAFKRILDAYDAITLHSGERSRASFVRTLPPAGLPRRSIFVLMPCYRDADGMDTLLDLFRKSDEPGRVFVGVVWQYAARKRSSVTRLFPSVNALTSRIEDEMAKMAKAEAEEADMQDYAQGCMPAQLKAQALAQDEEQKAHSRLALPEQFQERVRECHLDMEGAEGAGYLRHLGEALYAGEEYLLSIDAGTRFDQGWDRKLVDELGECPAAQAVLTGPPLGVRVGQSDFCGGGQHSDEDGARIVMPSDRRPPVPVATGFDGRGILRIGSQQVADRGSLKGPLPALFYSSSFAFSKAAAFFRDAPSDPHLPCLAFGDDVATSARLYTRGWEFFSPREPAVFKQYRSPPPELKWLREDAREGVRLYASEEEAAGPPGQRTRREFFQRSSALRVRQLLSGRAGERSEEVPLGPYGLGRARTLEDFWEHVGVSFFGPDADTPGELLERGSLGGLPPGALALDRKQGMLPDFRPGLSPLDGAAYA